MNEKEAEEVKKGIKEFIEILKGQRTQLGVNISRLMTERDTINQIISDLESKLYE